MATDPQKDKGMEAKLRMFLEGMNELVFITREDSVSGKVEQLEPEIKDMEGVIRISGEWDREDLKELLSGLV